MLLQPEFIDMSESDYFALDENSDIKYEYVNGQVYAMTGATVRHTLINNNTSTALANLLANTNCIVVSNDTRVKVESKISHRYPDTTVVCDKIEYVENRKDTIRNPIVIVEVLSPKTALIDRNQKLDEYTQISSLQEYILITQDEFKVERFFRQESGDWLYTKVTGLDGVLSLPSIGCRLRLADIYKKIELTDET